MEKTTKRLDKDQLEAIECCVKTFRRLKYGVLEKQLVADKGTNNKLIVIEAPRFEGDLSPVYEPGYFELNEKTFRKMYHYYVIAEGLLQQRFEQLQARRIIGALGKYYVGVEYLNEFTRTKVTFEHDATPPFPNEKEYDLTIFGLDYFVRDLLKFWREHCLDFSEIIAAIRQHIPLESLGWIIERNKSGNLIIRTNNLSSLMSHARTEEVVYTNDVDGIASFVTLLLKALCRQDMRSFISDPNEGR